MPIKSQRKERRRKHRRAICSGAKFSDRVLDSPFSKINPLISSRF
jgi:hypothetical protein